MVHFMYSNQTITAGEVYEVPTSVKTLVSVLWSNAHFVVMECSVEQRDIVIYDGYTRHRCVTAYVTQVKNVLMRCALLSLNTAEDFVKIGDDPYMTLTTAKDPNP